MARPFTDEEKARIRQRLRDVGRDLFIRQGLKKTSIEDLTRPAGIAKSSFYLFFETKEALYLELLMQEGAGVEERVMGASFRRTDDMREGIASFLHAALHEIDTNPLTRRLVTHTEDLELLTRHVSPEMLAAKRTDSLALILPFVRQGQARGSIIEGDPEIIAGAIRAITLLSLHKDDIGHAAYPAVINLLIDLVASGVTRTEPPEVHATFDQDSDHDRKDGIDHA
jgi:AcrR family transcriptional regulator